MNWLIAALLVLAAALGWATATLVHRHRTRALERRWRAINRALQKGVQR